jgi:hypothetical protein
LSRMEHIFGIFQDFEQIKKFFEQVSWR